MFFVLELNNADRQNPVADYFYSQKEADAFVAQNPEGGYSVHEHDSFDDLVGDNVHNWLANNPERLDHLYNDNAGLIAWKKEAAKRLVEREMSEEEGDTLNAWADEAEAPYAEVEFSSNDDGSYMLIEAGDDLYLAINKAEKALKFQCMSEEHVLDSASSYRVDANDDFRSDIGKWRTHYITRQEAEAL